MGTPLSLREAALYLNISPITVRRLLERGDGPRHFRVGKLFRFTREALDDYVRQSEQEQEKVQAKLKAEFLGK
jgi:excisionase family DNA binding protein